MSGHLSTEEKALFKAEIDAIRRKDYAFFIEFLEANKIKFKEQGNHCARRWWYTKIFKFLSAVPRRINTILRH
jgi:hypothetical protein